MCCMLPYFAIWVGWNFYGWRIYLTCPGNGGGWVEVSIC